MGRALRGFFSALVLLVLIPLCVYAENRALIITSGFFLSAPEIYPSADNNGSTAEFIFANAYPPFTDIVVLSDRVATREAFFKAVQDTFNNAGPDDVSYLYLSTHGMDEVVPTLLLSDGLREYRLTASDLAEALSSVPGIKVIIIDACHSGAFIGKGGGNLSVSHLFTGSEFKIITSSGADEDSWYWRYESEEGPITAGAGYFSDILSMGLTARGGYAADLNNDAVITLQECYMYLTDCHSVSTPRVYPENDDFVLLTYSPAGPDASLGPLSGILCGNEALSAFDPEILFEYTVTQPVTVAYRLVYHLDGRWAFNQSPLIFDVTSLTSDPQTADPGRKVRSLRLSAPNDTAYGYAMLQILTLSGGMLTTHFSRVLAVPPTDVNPDLFIQTASGFCPGEGEEMPVIISHQIPLEWSVVIIDEWDGIAARLKTRHVTRPEGLIPSGSAFYWDGRLTDRTPAPEGFYWVQVTAYAGEKVYYALSDAFYLSER